MTAYQIRLDYSEVQPGEGLFIGSQVARIMARDPAPEFEFPISHQCMSYAELECEVERLKKALDKVKVEARSRFDRKRRRRHPVQ